MISSTKKKILIVEDDEILAEYFARILRQDFETYNALSAETAIMLCEKITPDLIWLDLLLGEHSAFAFLNELRSYADTARAPVVVCSDVASNLGGANLAEYGVAKILDKSQMLPSEILRVAREVAQ